MQKTTDLKSNINYDALRDETKIDKDYLGRLVATYKIMFVPRTTLEVECSELKREPLEGVAPEKAKIEFNRLAKIFEAQPKVNDFLDIASRDHEVTIGLSSMIVDGKTVIPTGGTLSSLSGVETMAREVANILSMYTSQQKTYVSDLIQAPAAQEIGIPALSLTRFRLSLNISGSDNSETRDKIYTFLKSGGTPNRCLMLFILSHIYSHATLRPFSVKNEKYTAWYKANNEMKTIMPLSEVRVPYVTGFSSWTITTPIKVWRFYCKSLGVRGGRKGRGAISYGYYRFDLPSATIDLMNEMTDIYNICCRFKFKAVTLQQPDNNLARLLLYNGITVYCPAMSGVVQIKPKMVGVYTKGPLKSFLWMAMTQQAPTLSGASVTNPDPTPIVTNEISFVYQYIPLVLEKGYTYFPSIFAAEGLCIKTKLTSQLDIEGAVTDIKKFYERLSHAIYFRNWFPFTRVTYIAHDKHRSFFNYAWKYPKLTQEKREDLFAGAKEVAVEAKKDNVLYSSVQELESEAIEDDDGAEAEQALLTILGSMDQKTIMKIYASRSNFRPGATLEGIYFSLDKTRFFELIRQAIVEEMGNVQEVDPDSVQDQFVEQVASQDIEGGEFTDKFFDDESMRVEVIARTSTVTVPDRKSVV